MVVLKKIFNYLICFVLLTVSQNSRSETMTVTRESSTNTNLPLTISPDGVFMRNGVAYYGIGINYFNAFYRTIINNNDKSYIAGLRYLSDNKIPFVRFSINGFWPNELKLYRDNKALYFSLLDEFVRCAENYNVGLIPSLFWFYAAVPDLVGEHMNQWANPNSKTIAFMRTYTTEVVSRYKDSPAIWGWEFGNEVNAYCDLLDQAINFLPKVSVSQGTPATRNIEDAFTTKILQAALNEFATVVKQNDPNRAIFSGNSISATNAYHRYKYGTWDLDSSSDYTSLINAQNPVSLGALTLHLYPHQENLYFSDFTPKATLTQIIQESMRSSKELKRPLFLGEFGSPKTLGPTSEAIKFQELLTAIIDNKVQLSALWVFDFSYQDADWNITQDNSRKYQLDAIIAANSQFILSANNPALNDNKLPCSVYPNRTKDVIYLKISNLSDSELIICKLFDIQGRLLYEKKIESEITNINLGKLPSSIYLLKIISKTEEVRTFKIIKE